MAQYPVPQFIEEEGRIIYFLTFRQFFLLVGGGAVCFILYYTLPFSLFVILGLVVAGLVSAIAFLKINGLPVLAVAMHLLGYLMGAKTYIWKNREAGYPIVTKNSK